MTAAKFGLDWQSIADITGHQTMEMARRKKWESRFWKRGKTRKADQRPA